MLAPNGGSRHAGSRFTEVFTWSASGDIVTQSLASTLPTVVMYVVDTARTTSPHTFMSNMLYACSICFKTKLPFVLAFNKTDVCSHQFAVEWMPVLRIFCSPLFHCSRLARHARMLILFTSHSFL